MTFKHLALIATFCLGPFISAAPAHAVGEKYLGEIMITGATFCPRDTLDADGSLLPISSNSALFSLFGTQYGGDGRTTFALPDLRGEDENGNRRFTVVRYCVVSEGVYPSRR